MGDLSGHVGSDRLICESVIRNFGIGVRNRDRNRIVDFCVRNGMEAMNTLFQHRKQHRWTWNRWNHGLGRYTEISEIDFILAGDKRKVRDVKSIPSESMNADHRLMVGKLELNKPRRERIVKHKMIKVEEL